MDARNMGPGVAITYNRKDEIWKGAEGGGGLLKTNSHEIKAKDGRTEWNWAWSMVNDMQTNTISRFHQAEKCRGNGRTEIDPDVDMVNKYMSKAGLLRLGN